jgi:hypothetical protein
MKPINLFATPNSMKELETWLEAVRDPIVTTGAMMMYNLLVSKYDLREKGAVKMRNEGTIDEEVN